MLYGSIKPKFLSLVFSSLTYLNLGLEIVLGLKSNIFFGMFYTRIAFPSFIVAMGERMPSYFLQLKVSKL